MDKEIDYFSNQEIRPFQEKKYKRKQVWKYVVVNTILSSGADHCSSQCFSVSAHWTAAGRPASL